MTGNLRKQPLFNSVWVNLFSRILPWVFMKIWVFYRFFSSFLFDPLTFCIYVGKLCHIIAFDICILALKEVL